jgi:hypothetical protein
MGHLYSHSVNTVSFADICHTLVLVEAAFLNRIYAEFILGLIFSGYGEAG